MRKKTLILWQQNRVLVLKNQSVHNNDLSHADIVSLLTTVPASEVYAHADGVRQATLGSDVHLRGLIEFSNICRNDCLYCGIRRSNKDVRRYRMDEDELVETARRAVDIGFQTIVLQSGEDMYFDTDRMCRIIERIKRMGVALTLSIGERDYGDYRAFRNAGADRYLIRIETTDVELYHPWHELAAAARMPADDQRVGLRAWFWYYGGTAWTVGRIDC